MTIEQALSFFAGCVTVYGVITSLAIIKLSLRVRQLEIDRSDLAQAWIDMDSATKKALAEVEKHFEVRDKLIFGENCYAEN